MDFRDFVENMRQEVREEGFMSGIQLGARIFTRLKERDLIGEFDAERVLAEIKCEDIHTVEYTNTVAANIPCVKDLYYYNPWGK